MTDPTPTRAEVEAYPEIIWIGTDALQNDDEGCHVTYDPEATHIGYVRMDVHEALRERAEAAEAERKAADFRLVDRYRNPKTGIFNFPDDVAAIVRALDAARRAEAAAWNDAIEAAREWVEGQFIVSDDTLSAFDRALLRSAPTEGEA